MDVPPIAVSECIHNISSACCLSRFNEKAQTNLLPFQYGINTTDGVFSAIFATDVLFRQNESNVCMSLDFSNAFNSLSRCSIHGALLQYMPELMPYFQSTYSTSSNLHFGNSILSSSSGVKQGDPLGPLLFCLSIHPILLQTQEMFPSLKMIAYVDDVVFTGDLNFVKEAFVCFKELFTKIGLRLNLLKCVLLSNSPVSTIVDGIEIQAKLNSNNAIRHVGSFLGNNEEITNKLFDKLNIISEKIDEMMKLDKQKHIKFTIIRLCFSFNLNHIFRSTNPLITRPLAQKLLTKVLSQLLGCKMFQISDHAHLSPHYGGLGWTKASILTSCAFISGCRIAIFEFSERFADWKDLLMTMQSSTVFTLNDKISKIDVKKGVVHSPIIQWQYSRQESFKFKIHSSNITETIDWNFGSDDRGDVYCDWIDSSEAIVDFVSCNVANDILFHRRKLNPVSALDFKAKESHRKYDKDIEKADTGRNTQLFFGAIPFSINGRLSVEAETFLNDFQKMVQKKQ
ncbi:hypothetical protein P9112_005906 [Eukaryota sp. TZLM1-RC]